MATGKAPGLAGKTGQCSQDPKPVGSSVKCVFCERKYGWIGLEGEKEAVTRVVTDKMSWEEVARNS